MTRRIVAVFTGNRAEYGLQLPILNAIRAHSGLDYRLIVSGAHLDPDFGRTMDEIRRDGFEIHAEVKIEMAGDRAESTAHAIGTGIVSISRALLDVAPDILVVYADRFEGLAAVIAGSQMNIPTAHIEGGDITEGGALDDSVRHAMSKLAHIHVTTNQQATNRILAMGEEPWRVHTAGFPVIDLIHAGVYASADELREQVGIDPQRPLVVFTQHSVTTQFEEAADQLRQSLTALARCAENGIQVLATYPNNDAGGRAIIKELIAFAAKGLPNVILRPSLGRYRYHGALALALAPERRVACVGNSSSGIKETPAFACPTVNIGSRQQGRLRGTNVLDVDYDSEAIYAAIQRSLYDESFRRTCRESENPYGKGNSGRIIADVLATMPLTRDKILRKGMTLRGETRDGWYR